MIGGQTGYTFTISPTTGVSIDSTGVVKFTSTPGNGPITITVTKASPAETHTYTFAIKTWVEPKNSGPLFYNDYDNTARTDTAIHVCGGESNILTREEMTNSPQATGLIDQDWNYQRNYGTRGIGSLYSEWGYLTNYNQSDWVSAPYWTKDRRSNLSPNAVHFFVHSNDGGYVGYKFDHDNDSSGGGLGMRVACRD